MNHFVDTLLERADAKGAPVCVGLDPVLERLPQQVRDAADPRRPAEALGAFCHRVLDRVAAHTPCVKIQSACFERYGPPGLEVFGELIDRSRALGLSVIADVKRGDIGTSAAHYAAGLLRDDPALDGPAHARADAVTVSSYFGEDGLSPFVEAAAEHGRGVFALVRTSNPGGDAVQGIELKDGRTVAEAVAAIVAERGEAPELIGRRGYSLLGAVVGATKADEAAALRRIMPRQLFLVPGFGAQGGGDEGVRACLNEDGTGALVTASRSVIYAWEDAGADDWEGAVERAAASMNRRVGSIIS